MSQTIEHAREGLEHAHHAAHHGHGEHASTGPNYAKHVGILIAVLAAVLAMCEMIEKGASNEYLTHHISLSDDYNYYQAKRLRSTILASQANLLAHMPNASDDAVKQDIAGLQSQIARLEDDPKGGEGTKQLLERAKQQTEERDHALHFYHHFETIVGLLQIAIVLASVSVVIQIMHFALLSGIIGVGAGAYAMVLWFGLL